MYEEAMMRNDVIDFLYDIFYIDFLYFATSNTALSCTKNCIKREKTQKIIKFVCIVDLCNFFEALDQNSNENKWHR